MATFKNGIAYKAASGHAEQEDRAVNDMTALPYRRTTTTTQRVTTIETDDRIIVTKRTRIVSDATERTVDMMPAHEDFADLMRQGLVPKRNGFDD